MASDPVNVLIAEDSPTQAARLSFLLEQNGYSVTQAGNGREALELLEKSTPALVISDVMMPELDGFGLCRAIRDDPRWRLIPFMLVTTLTDTMDVIRGLECGADNFIRKPYEEKYLLSRIHYLLMNRSLRGEQRMQMGVEITLGDQRHFITSERQQILDLLISTYEQAVQINEDLKHREQDIGHANRVLNGLYGIAEGLNHARTEKDVLETALERALMLPGVRAGWIYLRDGDSFRLAAARGLPAALRNEGAMEGDCHCRRICATGELQFVLNIHTCERLSGVSGDTEGLCCHASIPLWLDQQTFGVMNLVGASDGLFDEEQLAVLHNVGNQVAVAIDRTRLREGLEDLVEKRTVQLETEIGQRRRSEESLHRSEALLQIASRVGRLGAWAVDLPDLAVTWSKEMRAIHEIPDESGPTFEEIFRFYDPEDLPRVEGVFRTAMRDGEPFDIEAEITTRKGRRIWVHAMGEGERDATGAVTRVHGALQDISDRIEEITDRKNAERRMLESEERYRLLFDRNPHPTWVYDAETLAFLAVNESAVQQYGFSREEFLSMTLLDIRPPDEIPRLLQNLNEEPETAQPRTFGVFHHRKKDGAVIEVEVSSSEITFSGRKAGLVLAMDVTERRQLEQQFLRAQRMESIGTLAGGIAHDLNNLLMPIMMGVSLLQRYAPDPRSDRTIENIERSARRATELVKQVLSFARGIQGSRVSVHMLDVVREVEAICEGTFPKNLRMEVDVPADLWSIEADPTQLNQVLLNFLVNARDAMPDGGCINVTVRNTEIDEHYARMHSGAAAGQYVMLEIADEGTGMPQEIVDRIFEPFFTTKEVGRGTGLGLSTVAAIVRSHGGFVNVYSEVGKGSVFRIHFPSREKRETREVEPAVEELVRGHGETILVVDDERAVVAITQATLEAFGYNVLVAEDGAQAIGLFALHRSTIAVVVTDMMMPVMDGPVLIAALRRIEPNVRIIASSGLHDEGKTARARQSGVRHFLEKPYSAAVLLRTLSKILCGEE